MPAASNQLGTAYVDVQGDFTNFNQQVNGALNGNQGKFAKWGKLAAVGVAAVGAAALVAGKELYKIGEAFDDASDTIRATSGKTGKALSGLEADFKAVVRDTPTDFGSASKAIATLNQKLGLTGKPLQQLTRQTLEYSRLTETDLNGNIKSLTRVFGDWGIKTEDQSKSMDKLFRASQKTGVPIAELGDSIVKFGAPLRQLGFSFEESAAMVGKFEKEGVNTQLVMGSMRQALGRLAKAGKDPQTEFAKTTEAIKAAGSAGEANKIALELFGARAGPDMAAAIREGRFEFGDLVKDISGGSDTIMKASADTADFAEKWQVLKNKVWLGLEPIATAVFGGVAKAIDLVEPAAAAVRDIVGQVRGAFDGAGEGSGKLSGTLTRLRDAFGGIKDIISTLVVYGKALWAEFGDDIIAGIQNVAALASDLVGAIVRIFQGVVDFVAGVLTLDLGRAWDGIRNIFGGVWDAIKAIIDAALDHIGIAAGAAWELIKQGIVIAWTAIRDWVAGLWEDLRLRATEKWNAVKNAVIGAIRDARDWLSGAWGSIRDRAVEVWTSIRDRAAEFWTGIKNRVQDAVAAARDTLSAAWASIRDRASEVWESIRMRAGAAWDAITGAVTGVFTGKDGLRAKLSGFWDDIKETAVDGWRAIRSGISTVVDGIAGGIEKTFKAAVSTTVKFINAIIGAVNAIPGVDIKAVRDPYADEKGSRSAVDVPGFARGAIVDHDRLAQGAMINRPLFAVGEEAPRWPEAIIPFNPAYRGRAMGLFAETGRRLGVPGFASGGIYSQSEMEDLWVAAGGPSSQRKIAGAVGMAESRGNSQVVNGIGAGGLWQIHPPEPGYLNPMTNARIAVRKWRESGWRPWEAYTGPDGVGSDGPWRQFADKGFLGEIVDAVMNPLDFAKGIIGKLPKPDLPDWLSGMGPWALGKAKDWITSKAKSIFGGGAGGVGDGSPVWNEIMGLAGQTGNIVTSGFRPGDDGWHGKNRAKDFAGGDMMRFAKLVSAEFGENLLELIHTPLGYGIKNGQKVPPYAAADHYDHVHVAFRKGGMYGPEGPGNFVGSFRTGGIVPADGYAYVHQGETVTPAGTDRVGDVYVSLDGGRTFERIVDARIEQRERLTAGLARAGVRP